MKNHKIRRRKVGEKTHTAWGHSRPTNRGMKTKSIELSESELQALLRGEPVRVEGSIKGVKGLLVLGFHKRCDEHDSSF